MNEPKQVQVEDEGVAGLFGWYISYYIIINCLLISINKEPNLQKDI